MSSPFAVLILLACVWGFWSWLSSMQVRRRRFKLKSDLRCEEPTSVSQSTLLFGLDTHREFFRAIQDHRLNQFQEQQVLKHGRTFQHQQWATRRIFTVDPNNLKAIFATDFKSWGIGPRRHFALGPVIGKGVLTTDGTYWTRSRVLIRPTFAKTKGPDLAAFDAHVTNLLQLLPSDGSTVDLRPLFKNLSIDFITEFLFGESIGILTSCPKSGGPEFLAAYEYAQAGCGLRMQLPRSNLFFRDRKWWSCCDIVHAFVDRYVGVAPTGKQPQQHILAHELAEQKTDRTELRNQLLNVFLPGYDAIGHPLAGLFFFLARHPTMFAKLRAEILQTVGPTQSPTPETLNPARYPYLYACIHETLRFVPPLSVTGRVALTDTVLPTGGGASGTSPIFVEQGTNVRTNFWVLHRDKQIWGEDADCFRPERWEGNVVNAHGPDSWTYMSFGGGPRTCPGMHMGLACVAYAAVRVVQRFKDVQNRDPVWEFLEEYRIVTQSANGVKVGLIPA